MSTQELELKSALLEFDTGRAKKILLQNIVSRNETIPVLIEKVLTSIGEEWASGELALSQVYMSGQICEKIVDEIFAGDQPRLMTNHRMAIVTFNDFHVLGKKIVSSILRSVGFQMMDLGCGLNAETLVSKVEKEKVEILLVSVLMLPSALKVKDLKDLLLKKNMPVKILVGGAPFVLDELLWKKVGADAMAKSATDAIGILNDWLNN